MIPVCFDMDGVMEGLRRRPPGEVVLIYQLTEESREEKISRRNAAAIQKSLEPMTSVIVCEIASRDIFEIFLRIMTTVSAYPTEEYELYANVSSGTPLMNALLLLCAMARKFRAYIVEPDRILIPPYKTELTKGTREMHVLPFTPLHMPDGNEMNILAVLTAMGGEIGSQMDLLSELEKTDFFGHEKYFQRRKHKILANRKTMLSRILKRMERNGLVEIGRVGRRSTLSITPTGRLLGLKQGIIVEK